MRLLKDVVHSLGWRYGAFVAATVGFALIAMLPAELLVFFTEKAELLSGLSAPQFIAQLAVFGSAVAVALFLSSIGNTFCHEWLRLKLEADLRRRVLTRIHDVPLPELDGLQRGDWIARVTKDLETADWFLADSIPGQIRHAAILAGAGLLFILHSGWLAAIPLATALLLGLVNLRLQKKLASELMELRELHGNVYQLLIESLEGVRTIRSQGAQPHIQRRFDGNLAQISGKSLTLIRFVGILRGSNELVGQLMVTVCLSAVAWTMSRGGLSVQQFLVYPFFIGMFYNSAQTLAGASYDWNRFFAEGGRLAEILFGEPQRAASLREVSRETTEPSQLSVTSLAVGYKGLSPIGPIDFRLQRGELWAIMGPSGCGKSTFLEVLSGLRPALAGRAELRDARGRCIWDSTRHGVSGGVLLPSASIAYVEQHPYIFEGTLRENLVFGNPERMSDTVLWAFLEKTGLHRFAAGCGGLGHQLHDRGRNLSEGERYRIALCRALLLRRPFLLLDEPFAALDSVSLDIVLRTLTAEKALTGIAVVTHNLPPQLPVDGVIDFGMETPTRFPVDEPIRQISQAARIPPSCMA